MTLVVAASLVNISARGRPSAVRTHNDSVHETGVLVDAAPNPNWRSTSARSESAVASDVSVLTGTIHVGSRAEVGNANDATDGIGLNSPPNWGSAAGAVFDLKQGETLDLSFDLKFTDADNDPLTITHLSGNLPNGVTYDPATHLLTAALDAQIGLSEDLVFRADDNQVTVRNVGPGKQYSTVRAAILACNHGDVIQIDPGDYIGDVATITKNNLLIKGTSTTNRARLFANGTHQSGKGILVLEGDDCTFENMEFHQCSVPDQNGAGVRHDGAGLTTFRNCGFFDNENGILSGGGGDVLLEFCEFARNGFGDGQTHNCYFLTHNVVTARDCYFHEAHIGHEFKSRARENILERCYFVNGPTGDASYLVNADNGGRLIMRGCMLQKSTNADNSNSIFHNSNTWGPTYNSITLEHCTLVHQYPTGSFINLASGSTVVTLTACLFASNGRPLVSGATPTQSGTVLTTVDKIPNASNISDPDFWPDVSIWGLLDLGVPLVPTYLIDAPDIFVRRDLTSAPTVCGAIQNSLTGLPSWLVFPTQLDEQNMYDNVLGWAWVPADKTTTFALTNPATPLGVNNNHNESEADDCWNHYVQYKRTVGSNTTAADIHLTWAERWRNYYTIGTEYEDNMRSFCTTYGDHMYGPGLVLWGMERNDLEARERAKYLLSTIEAACLALVPGTSNMTSSGSRRFARALILACYVSMMEPIARWITLRDHLINAWMGSSTYVNASSSIAPPIIGGMYPEGRPSGTSTLGGWSNVQYDQGFRWTHSMYHGMHCEALWLAFMLTGRNDVRNRFVELARYVLHYAWDMAHANPMCGSRWGHRPVSGVGSDPNAPSRNTAGFLHDFSDEYVNGVAQTPPPSMNTDPNIMSTDNYESSLVGLLTRAYKLTGEVAFFDRAKAHLRQATCYANATLNGGPWFKTPQNEVRKYVDTELTTADPIYFNFNKGMLQYAYAIFENGGNPVVMP